MEKVINRMKFYNNIILLFLEYLLVPFILFAKPGQTDITTSSQPFELHRFTLDNGLTVWCQPRADSKSVVVFLVVRAGSRYENHENNGMSHFVEHMVFCGTERWNENEIGEIIRKRGGKSNGWTSEENTVYYAEVAAQDFEIALDWVTEVVFHATFPADKVDKERNVIFHYN